jgi:hypothetical protein
MQGRHCLACNQRNKVDFQPGKLPLNIEEG